MFSIFDIINIGIILILVFFLFVLFQFEKSFAKPRVYLRSALFFALFILIIFELISLHQYSITIWFYPLSISAYFLIYPLIYVYSKNLVFYGKGKRSANLIYISILPAAILIYLSFIFYPLDYESKIRFMTLHLSESAEGLPGYKFYQYAVFISYYIQAIFYLTATLNLISVIKKNISRNPWELLLAKYILFYVIAVVLYESFAICCSVFIKEVQIIKMTDALSTLLFISFGLFVAFKQSLIVIQSKIYIYAEKLQESSKEIGEDAGRPNQQISHKVLLTENEKQEIKAAIENYFSDSKIYLDPNLKLEQLAKKIHIPMRKISMVINEIFGTNFNHFISEYRISEAKKIISNHPKNVVLANIYTNVGFNSRSSFNRVFKEITGISPTDFIKELSDKEFDK